MVATSDSKATHVADQVNELHDKTQTFADNQVFEMERWWVAAQKGTDDLREELRAWFVNFRGEIQQSVKSSEVKFEEKPATAKMDKKEVSVSKIPNSASKPNFKLA